MGSILKQDPTVPPGGRQPVTFGTNHAYPLLLYQQQLIPSESHPACLCQFYQAKPKYDLFHMRTQNKATHDLGGVNR